MLCQRAIGEFALMTQSEGTAPDYTIQLDEEPIVDRVHLVVLELYVPEEA